MPNTTGYQKNKKIIKILFSSISPPPPNNTASYGHDTAGRLDRVWHHPTLTNGVPQGNPPFSYGFTYTQPNPGDLRIGATTGANLKQDFMPYTLTPAASLKARCGKSEQMVA